MLNLLVLHIYKVELSKFINILISDYYRSLIKQQKEIKLQVDRFKKEYHTIKNGSDEAIAISATITMFYVEYAIDQEKIIDLLNHQIKIVL